MHFSGEATLSKWFSLNGKTLSKCFFFKDLILSQKELYLKETKSEVIKVVSHVKWVKNLLIVQVPIKEKAIFITKVSKMDDLNKQQTMVDILINLKKKKKKKKKKKEKETKEVINI